MYHPRIDFHYDWESRSHLDISVVGPVNYWAHPSTEATRLTWKFGRTGPVKIWRPLIEPVPQELLDVAFHPERYNFIAWNILFDYLGWICWFLPKKVRGGKRPELFNLNDAMALSCHFRTGASLESAAKMLGLPINKDPVGRAIMLKQCKPNSRTGQYPILTAEEEAHFDRYSIVDTRILAEVWYLLPPLPEPERYAWEWTFRRNLEGIRVDLDLVAELNAIVDAAMPPLEAEFALLTGGLKINSHEKVRDWFKQFYPHIDSMRADVIRDLLLDSRPVPLHVRRALEIKDLAGSSSIAKLKTANALVYFGRIYELLAYHYAGTKRWAGRGIQIQNFPRVNKKRPDSLKFDMNVENLAATVAMLRPGLKDPVGFVKNLLRRIWLPDPGDQFYCGDFSKVEPSVLFWLCDMGPIPKLWYEEMAAEIFNKRVEEIEDGHERTVAKIANLSCQYGTGGDGYRKALHKDTGIVLSEEEGDRVVKAYRRKNQRVVQFWRELEDAFRLAIYGQTSSLCRGRVHFIPLHLVNPGYKGVAIRLPSGSYLYYHKAEEVVETFNEEVVELKHGVPVKTIVKKQKKVLRYMSDFGGGKVGWKYVYGGKLCVGEGTLVLAKRGWVEIERITCDDVLWDGVEWVKCDGNVFNGEKETIQSHGAWFTPDHLILTDKGWRDASQGKRYNRAACRLPDGYTIPWIERVKVLVASSMRLWKRGCFGSHRVQEATKEKGHSFVRLPEERDYLCEVNQSRNGTTPGLCSMAVDEATLSTSFAPCLGELRGQRYNCLRAVARVVREFLGGYGCFLPNRAESRPNRQQRGLLKRKLQMGDSQGASEQQTKLKKVYDVVNCGPRNRFVVLAGGLPLIVHNCENVVSATARDVIVPATWQLENAGFKILGLVHDEIWGSSHPGRDEEFKRLMCINPSWCDMEINSDLKVGVRYLK